jgi:sugar lactone lactonase YvrE
METKPIRVFLQDGLQDINIYSNYELGAALRDAGYDYKLVIGTEGHNSKHSSAILPDALRWLWREHPKPIAKPVGGTRHYLTNNVIPEPDQNWEVVSQGHASVGGAAADKNGELFFSDPSNNRIYRIADGGRATVFKENTGGAGRLMFGSDGRLYACQTGKKRVVAYSADGKESVVADGIAAQDLAVNTKGDVYVTDPANRRVWRIDSAGKKHIVHDGIESPSGIRFSPDHSFLAVSDTSGRWIWSFLVGPDGSLQNAVPFHRLEIPDEVESGSLRSGAGGMAADAEGFLYVATNIGIQICDPAGRTVGILSKPRSGDISSVVFGGPVLQTLYVTSGDSIFRRQIRRKGSPTWMTITPPKPRL